MFNRLNRIREVSLVGFLLKFQTSIIFVENRIIRFALYSIGVLYQVSRYRLQMAVHL